MIIRDATLDDANRLAQVRIAAWRQAYRGIMPDAVLDGMDYEKEVHRWHENLTTRRTDYLFVAELDGQAAGFVAGGACRDSDPEYDGELYAIYVLPELQGQGAGKALAQAAMEWLRAQGYHKMLIWVLRDNQPARRFYEALGGAAVHERSIEIRGTQLSEVGYGYSLG
jgi:ribosomal protein S18 acetylase RimI-like enzyme